MLHEGEVRGGLSGQCADVVPNRTGYEASGPADLALRLGRDPDGGNRPHGQHLGEPGGIHPIGMATGAKALQIYRVGQQDPTDMSRNHIVHFKKMSQLDKAQYTSDAQAVRPFLANVPERGKCGRSSSHATRRHHRADPAGRDK